jgi:hypothetical protein
VIDIDVVIKEVSKRLNLDKDIVATVCKHPYICTVEVMKDKEDVRDILFNELLKFKLKRRYKEDKTKQYSSK